MQNIKSDIKPKAKVRLQASDVFFYAFAILLTIMILLPFVWLFLSSIKTNAEYYMQPSPIFSKTPQWSRYHYVFVTLKFWRYMINSVVLAVICVVLNVLSSSFVSYGFARFRFKGKEICYVIMLATMFLPGQVTQIPQFMVFNKLGWLDTVLPIVVPQFFGSAVNILLVTNFFRGIPREMDEAAKIDGANSFRIWWNILLPQAVSVIVVVAISSFLGSWKDSMGPLIYLRSERLYTVPVALLFFQSPDQNSYLLLLSGVVISVIPTLVMYVFMQKWLNNGVYIADLK